MSIKTQTREQALAALSDMTVGFSGISAQDFQDRLDRLQKTLRAQNISATYLHAGTSMYYFTGLRWSPSERMVATLIPAIGPIRYISPRFEIDTLKDYWQLEAEILTWEEHESPYQIVNEALNDMGITSGKILIDPITPFFTYHGLTKALDLKAFELDSGANVIESIRGRKSPIEIELIQRSHEMTARVLEAAASILHPGISTTEVCEFINTAHRKVGAEGSTFCIALFGVATSFPHGVKNPQILKPNDWVLLDTGCLLHGYHSDITRTIPFGSPTTEQEDAWHAERDAQCAAFAAAMNGVACEECDLAARRSLESAGFGPDYQLPGLPHRTGHGCGLDIHESPNLVRGNKTLLESGMVFSNEPMLVIPGKFGVRLEDHFYMTDDGPVWFTQPAPSIHQLFTR